MIRNLFFGLLLTSASMNTYASNELYYLGGGGEGSKKNTIFDHNIEIIKKINETKNFLPNISFNGGHKTTESLLKTHFPNKKVTNFTEKEFLNKIAEIEKKLDSNSVKKGEKLLLIFDSHGASSKVNETAHSISYANNTLVKDYNNLSGNGLVSLDKLKRIITKAESKGVKLGIVDLSCHSGATLNLLQKISPSVCIISSTGPNHYGFAGASSFASLFLKNLTESNTNLEDAFTKARASSTDVGYPMISTTTHESIEDLLYKDLTNLYYYQRKNLEGKLANLIEDKYESCATCEYKSVNNVANLKLKITSLKLKGIISSLVAKDLIENIDDYTKFQDNILKEYSKLQLPKLKNTTSFNSVEINKITKQPILSLTLNWNQILNFDEIKTDKIIKIAVSKLKNNPKYANYNIDQMVKKIKLDIKANKKLIEQKNPDLAKARDTFNNLLTENNITFMKVRKISKIEKKAYDQIYKSSFRMPNACNQFTL